MLIGVWASLLVGILAALFWLANRTSDIAPQLLTDVLLYALLAVDLALLAALGFRARAQPPQALGRAASRRAVRTVSRQAGGRACWR